LINKNILSDGSYSGISVHEEAGALMLGHWSVSQRYHEQLWER